MARVSGKKKAVSVALNATDIWAPQAGPQLMATLCPARIILFGGSRGGGKMLSNDSKILTPKGWKTHGEIKVGDVITDPETGGAQRVIGVYPQGELDLYRVTFDDGASVLAGLEHLWRYSTFVGMWTTGDTKQVADVMVLGVDVFVPKYPSMQVKVTSIEFSHRGLATCIKVSSPHGLYIADDYIVTHNTDCAIGKQVYGALRYGADWNGLFIRKSYKYFADIRRRLNQMIRAGLPAELIGPQQGTNYLRFENGANVTLTVVESIEKAEFFQGQSFSSISIEEACQFSYIDAMIEMLKGCMRSAAGVPTSMFLTANPGGPGHSSVKARFMPMGVKPGQIVKDDSGMTMVFIPSRVEDNKILCDNDPEYVNLLRSIKDPALRRAWLEGDWDVVLGGFFGDVWNHFRHVVPSFKPPMHWPRIVGMDWGSATPFSIGWYCVADGETSVMLSGVPRIFPKGALIRFHEWYGCPKNAVTGRIEANVGLRLQSSDVAIRMVDMEQRMPWLLGRTTSVDRVADPSIFAEKDGPSVAEKFAECGVVWRRAENRRISGWDSVRKVLNGRIISQEWGEDENGERILLAEEREPMLYFTDNNEHMIRTLPEQERDAVDFEDVATDGEDHACVTLDTMVLFNGESISIGDIVGQSGAVVSIDGVDEVGCECRITRRQAPIMRLEMEDGEEVFCTPDHKFFARSGWTQCEALGPGSELKYVDRNVVGTKSHYWKKVSSVSFTGRNEPVACLYSPITHSFILSSGLISHNCDELRYVVTSRPSAGITLSSITRPAPMTACEIDFAQAEAGVFGNGVIDELSIPRSSDMGVPGEEVGYLNVHIAK